MKISVVVSILSKDKSVYIPKFQAKGKMNKLVNEISDYRKLFGISDAIYILKTVNRINHGLKVHLDFGMPSIEQALTTALQGGRRLRGSLVLISAGLFDIQSDDALTLAVAIEFLHRAAVVHDDIVDHDEFRRGKPSIPKLYGDRLAIILGDLLVSLAFETLKETKLSAEKVIECYDRFSKLFFLTCKGELKDILWEAEKNVAFDEVIVMEYEKTAAFGETAMYLGALVANASQEHASLIMNYGKLIGLAFQLHNDVRDIEGTHHWSKKRIAIDLRERKMTPIMAKAIEMADQKKRREINQIFDNNFETDLDVSRLISIIRDTGALKYIHSLIRSYLLKAQGLLSVFPDSRSKRILLNLGSENYLNMH